MDSDMDMLALTVAGSPIFMPIITIERSESCATRKLTLCTDFGISLNEVSGKFAGHVLGSTDLSSAEYRARKVIVQQVERWCEAHEISQKKVVYKNEWAPILYKYEIVKTAAKTERDWGHLLFTDMTLSHFMLVMVIPEACNCSTPSHHDYGALTRYHADQFMSLLIYLHEEWGWGNKPGWIRATYVTDKEKFKLNSDFLDNIARTPGENRKDGRPSIYVVTPNNFNPTLLPSELAKIDNTVARSATRLGRKGSDARRRVLGTKESRPNINSALRPQNLRKCAFCKAVKKLRELHSCNRCKLTWYCSEEWYVPARSRGF